MKKVYLDYNATTPVLPEVLAAMMPFFSEKFGNSASLHSFGKEAAVAKKSAAEKIALSIGATANEIVFTSGGTQANNLAINSLAAAGKQSGKKRIITSQIEHKSTYNACQKLEENGFELIYLTVNRDGLIDLDELEKNLDDDVALVSLLLVNNETGTIQDFEKISKIIKKYDVPLHYDAIQALGKMPVDVKELGASLLSLSSHKLYGPKGAGALYIGSGIKIVPPAKTYDIPSIVGFGVACEIAHDKLNRYVTHCKKMRDYLESEILKACSTAAVNGSIEQRICNTSNISFPGFLAKNLSEELDRRGIAVSTGAACGAKDEFSRVLAATKITKLNLYGALRFSVGEYISKDDIDYVIQNLKKILKAKTKILGKAKLLNLKI